MMVMNMFWFAIFMLSLTTVITSEDATLGIDQLNLEVPVMIYTSVILLAEEGREIIG